MAQAYSLSPASEENFPAEREVYVLPTSSGQQRLWFLDQLHPGTSAYNLPIALRADGNLDATTLEKSLQEIVRRHESLRTTFEFIEGQPSQVISAEVDFKLQQIDLSDVPEAWREERSQQLIREEVRRPFDLRTGPLFRGVLCRISPKEHILLLNMHHIIADGWSFEIILREMGALYECFAAGDSSPLDELSLQYADYAQWQREYLSGDHFKSQLDYWKKQLEGASASLDLPTDRPRPASPSLKGAIESLLLPRNLMLAIKELSRREGTTVFMTLLAAYKALLYRYTGQTDIAVGSPVANRTLPEIESLIGFFVNTLVFRTRFSGAMSFRELMSEVREVSLQAYTHQDAPFEKLVEEMQPERDLNRNPFFQTLFICQKAFIQPVSLPGLNFTPFRIDRQGAALDLTFFLVDREEGTRVACEYSTDLFDSTTIRRLLGHFEKLLQSAVLNPWQKISQLPLLTEKESHQILREWNETRREYPTQVSLHQFIEEQVERTPDAIAVSFRGERVSYWELNQRANQLAHHLRKQGVGRDVLVGVCMERSVEMVVGLLGILKAGGAYLPLDPEYPDQRLAFMIEEIQSPVMLTSQGLAERISKTNAQVICLDRDWPKIAVESEANPVSDVKGEDLAYVIYTSGSTGRPKGAMNTHLGICNRLLWMQDEYQLGASDAVMQKTPYSFDVSVWEFFWPLMTGARLVVAEPGGHRDVSYLVRTIEEEKITTMHFVPSMLQMFLESRELRRCGSLKRVICSGEALSADLQERFYEKLGAELHNLYGPTEAAVDVTYWACRRGDGRRSVPIGRPIANTEIYILDQNMNPVPVGVAGELHIGGAGLARGYLNREELTGEKFVRNPFSQEWSGRLYKTGDLARYLEDGNIEYIGRADYQVKIRGMRIELGEIEAAINEQAGVRESVVVAREDGGDKRLVGYVVAAGVSAEELRRCLQEKLPSYMVPTEFVMMDAFPLTHSGKVDRRALPAPDPMTILHKEEFVAPRTEWERRLAGIWEELLDLRPISVKDNFFELGGHSLMAVSMFSQIEDITGKPLPLSVLFDAPTIEQLAELLHDEDEDEWSSLVSINPNGSKPPLFCIHAGGGNVLFYRDLARRLGEDQPFYALQPRGLDGRQPRHTRIEDMAEHYIEEIRRLQPEGPYYLGGSSFGGLVAFEMGRQLTAQGQKVALVALFDTYAPGYPRLMPGMSRVKYSVSRLAQRIEHHLGSITLLEPGERMPYILEKADKAKRAIRRAIKRKREQVSRLYYRAVGRPLPRALRITQDAIAQAQKSYVPQPYCGRLTLFRATKQPSGIYPDPTLGWQALGKGGIEIYEVPGTHGSIIAEPRVRFLVNHFQSCLDRLQTAETQVDVSEVEEDRLELSVAL